MRRPALVLVSGLDVVVVNQGHIAACGDLDPVMYSTSEKHRYDHLVITGTSGDSCNLW